MIGLLAELIFPVGNSFIQIQTFDLTFFEFYTEPCKPLIFNAASNLGRLSNVHVPS